MTTVFISHSSKDSEFAGGFLKPFLEKKGMTVWCSSADMPVARVNNKQITAPHLLKVGDTIDVGAARLLLEDIR